MGAKLLLLVGSGAPIRTKSKLKLKPLHCTVQSLKYVPVASIIGWLLWEPDWASVGGLGWGS